MYLVGLGLEHGPLKPAPRMPLVQSVFVENVLHLFLFIMNVSFVFQIQFFS